MRSFVTLFCFLCVFFLGANRLAAEEGAGKVLDLPQLYQLVLQQSEQLKITAEQITVAEAQYRQAIAALFPVVDLGVAQRFRDDESFGQLEPGVANPDNPIIFILIFIRFAWMVEAATPTCFSSSSRKTSQLSPKHLLCALQITSLMPY